MSKPFSIWQFLSDSSEAVIYTGNHFSVIEINGYLQTVASILYRMFLTSSLLPLTDYYKSGSLLSLKTCPYTNVSGTHYRNILDY